MSEHAQQNAAAWLETIREYALRLRAARESQNGDAVDEINEEIQQSVLSVQVRDGWRNPGANSQGAEEYKILLSAGGPALRITGKLDGSGSPDDWPSLEWQDWGTPWIGTQLFGDTDRESLILFANCFYFSD